MMKRFLLIMIFAGIFCQNALALDQKAAFDFRICLTQQDKNMDWWYSVPAKFIPRVSRVQSVSKGEYFSIIPIFNNYGLDKNKRAKIEYDVAILKPDNTVYEKADELEGWNGKAEGLFLIPAKEKLAACFEPEDAFGEYIIRIEAFDRIKGQKAEHKEKIKLEKFSLPEIKDEEMSFIFDYPYRPDPEKAMASFLKLQAPFVNPKGQILWSAVWFYKYVFEENQFLVPEMVKVFKASTDEKQKKDIIMLFHFINKIKELQLGDEFREYLEELKKTFVPKPYAAIKDPSQLDMLWGEFFATGRVKPVRQIISAFALSQYMGTMEKIKDKKLDINDKEVERKAMLEATFSSAIWSLESNCNQSDLLLEYCVGLIESEKINKQEKGYLGVVLTNVFERKKKEHAQKKSKAEQ